MNWIILIVAGLCEVGFTYSLGKAKGVTGVEWWTWISAFAIMYVLSAVFLAKATQTIPIGTAYPVWTGVGAVGAVLVGIFMFRCNLLEVVLPYYAYCINNRIKSIVKDIRIV